jgi:Dolichyl-phosphate-mannose-protein mannosyltransferase
VSVESRGPVVVLIGLAALAAVTLWVATGPGIGITPDSTIYIDAARHLRAGDGFVALDGHRGAVPVTQYPPLYPALLALFGLACGDPLTAARPLHALLFGANVLLVGLLIRKATGASPAPPPVGSLLAATSVDLLRIHTVAISEPLFLFLMTLSLYLLAGYARSRNWARLWLCSGLMGLALLTRYAGAALVAAAALHLWRRPGRPRSRAYRDVAIALGAGILPVASWIVRNVFVAGDAVRRSPALHSPSRERLGEALLTASGWLLPGSWLPELREGLMIALCILAIGGAIRYGRGRASTMSATATTPTTSAAPGPDGPPAVISVLTGFLIAYAAMLLASISFVDANTPLDDRILAPAFVAALVIGVTAVARWLDAPRLGRSLRTGVLAAILLFTTSYLIRAATFVSRVRQDGQGYASRVWTGSPLVARVRLLSPGVRVYSNAADAIQFLAERPADPPPPRIDPGTRRINGQFEAGIAQVRQELIGGSAVLVWFDAVDWRWYHPSRADLRTHLAGVTVTEMAGGDFYGAPPEPTPRP